MNFRSLIIFAPFKMLGLGYYYANIKIDEEYLNKTSLFTDINISNQADIFVLSSIGSEIIFKQEISSATIFRVPKNNILLIKQVDTVLKNQQDKKYNNP